MNHFTPWAAAAGGLLIGLAANLLWIVNGRIAGISGIVRGGLLFGGDERLWRALFLGGLVLGCGAWGLVSGYHPLPRVDFSRAMLCVGGLLVGYGSALSRGCTSGHGVCGLARLSPRSLASTGTFLAVAIVTTYLVRHVFHIT